MTLPQPLAHFAPRHPRPASCSAPLTTHHPAVRIALSLSRSLCEYRKFHQYSPKSYYEPAEAQCSSCRGGGSHLENPGSIKSWRKA